MNFKLGAFAFFVANLLMLSACGDDKSSSPHSLPDEVADKAELETYECNMSVIGEKIFVKNLGVNYECDGDEWFKSYDQPKSSTKVQSSSSFSNSISSGIIESKADENQTCTEVPACDAMDKNDAIKLECDAAHEGLFRLIEDGYEVCKNSAWVSAKEEVAETNGESCSADDIGRVIDGKLTNANKYYCAEKGWINAKKNWEWLPRDVHLNPNIKYDSIVDERDGKVYKIVKIGEQVWMAQNLAYEVEGSGRCVEYRGCFYDWVTTVGAPGCGNEYCGGTSDGKIQGVCPKGWHVPTLAEWKQLLDFVGGDDVEVEKRLMSKTAWKYATGESDTVGFSALPLENTEAGRYSGGNWYARFWSATGRFSGDAYDLMIFADKAYSLAGSYKSLGLSVRCVRDE